MGLFLDAWIQNATVPFAFSLGQTAASRYHRSSITTPTSSIMAEPLKPHWVQPSHPEIQEVIINEANFSSKSLSRVSLSPNTVYARMTFPPCTVAPKAGYSTVQFDKDQHLELNSDLLYINHSCEPSLVSLAFWSSRGMRYA
jgi:hypothetical protein